MVELKRRIAQTDLGIQSVGHGARKRDVSRVQRQIKVVARNVRDRQVSQPHVCRNAHHVIGKLTRQLNGDLAVMDALVIAVELANLECRALDLDQILSGGIGSRRPLCNVPAFDDTYRSVRDTFNLDRPRRHIQVERLERVFVKSRARKLLRPIGIVAAIQKIVLVKHIVHTRQAGYNIVEIPRAIKMNQSSRNAKNKPDNQYKRSDANAQAYLGFMRKLHHSSPSLAHGSAVAAVATPASGSAEVSFPWALIATDAGPT